jgi:hypothetical protein
VQRQPRALHATGGQDHRTTRLDHQRCPLPGDVHLDVLAMLEGLKGDAGEVTRLAAHPDRMARISQPGQQQPPATAVRRTTGPATPEVAAGGGGQRPSLPTRPRQPDTTTVAARLQAAYAQPRPDGQAWTARTLAQAAGCGRSSAASFLQRHRPPAREPIP